MCNHQKIVKVKSVFVYCEITEEGNVAEVSLELLSKGRKLANELSTNLEAVLIGHNLNGVPAHIFPYGVDVVHLADHPELFHTGHCLMQLS